MPLLTVGSILSMVQIGRSHTVESRMLNALQRIATARLETVMETIMSIIPFSSLLESTPFTLKQR